jgi:hypothetical protein
MSLISYQPFPALKALGKSLSLELESNRILLPSLSDFHLSLKMPNKRRDAPGSHGTGKYYRIVVRPKQEFVTFRVHDVGRKGHAERLAGKRDSGSWATHAWLISKKDAHVERERLVGDSKSAKQLIESLTSVPERIAGDIFRAKDVKKYGMKRQSQAMGNSA